MSSLVFEGTVRGLRLMGYREMGKHPKRADVPVYGKPVGYNLLMVTLGEDWTRFEQRFINAKGECDCYARQVCDPMKTRAFEDMVRWLKEMECWHSKTNGFPSADASFASRYEFLTKDELAEEVAEGGLHHG